MPRKTTSPKSKRAGSTAKESRTGKTARKPAGGKAETSSKKRTSQKATTKSKSGKSAPAARESSARPSVDRELSPSEVLTRAETDITAAIDALNQQMNAALETFTELASVHQGKGKAVIRTAPLDRATATFQRLIAECLHDQLSDMLPPLVGLRNEMHKRASDGAPDADFCRHACQTLDHVLSLGGAQVFEPDPGELFDPVIHLGVGETSDEQLADGVVAACVQPGYRSARGEVLVPAKVKVNRR